jgi:hypothetical protein
VGDRPWREGKDGGPMKFQFAGRVPQPDGDEAMKIIQGLLAAGALPKLEEFEQRGPIDGRGDCLEITPWVVADMWNAFHQGSLRFDIRPWAAVIAHDREGNANTWMTYRDVIVDFTPSTRGIVVISSQNYRCHVLDKITRTQRFPFAASRDDLLAYFAALPWTG